jgi:hypothetical protein
MSEIDRLDGDDSRLAMLYAAGELDEVAAAAFERRLADDQTARDALCAAVRLRSALDDSAEPVPDPAYRKRVRQRLRASGTWRRVTSRTGYRWQPVLWSLAGAAAAALVLSISVAPRRADSPASQSPVVADEAPEPPHVPATPGDNAEEWPDLMGGRHLAEAVDEENRRRVRAEDRGMVRLEDRATRLRGAPVYRQ